jgi:uncharacterized protein (UPF0548 family)
MTPTIQERQIRTPLLLFLLVLGVWAFLRGIVISDPTAMLMGSVVIVAVGVTLWLGWIVVRREHRAQVETGWLTQQPVTYPVSAMGDSLEETLVANPPKGYRATERRARIAGGRKAFERAAAATLRWEVKTRAGFRVTRVRQQGSLYSDAPVVTEECAIVKFGPIRETVRVIRIVDEPRRRGFAYGTLPEHPLRGEEAFLVEWRDDDTVELVIRSFSRPSTVYGWIAYPLLVAAQNFFVRRYLRVLLE